MTTSDRQQLSDASAEQSAKDLDIFQEDGRGVTNLGALVIGTISVVTLVANAWVIPVVMAIGCGMPAVYYSVQHPLRERLREHESEQRR